MPKPQPKLTYEGQPLAKHKSIFGNPDDGYVVWEESKEDHEMMEKASADTPSGGASGIIKRIAKDKGKRKAEPNNTLHGAGLRARQGGRVTPQDRLRPHG